jgi:hypothetical protein
MSLDCLPVELAVEPSSPIVARRIRFPARSKGVSCFLSPPKAPQTAGFAAGRFGGRRPGRAEAGGPWDRRAVRERLPSQGAPILLNIS